MYQLKQISTLIILAGLIACGPAATFDEPQPAETENLSKFPRRLQGQYLSLADNSVLEIGDKLIQRIYDYDYVVHPNELDSTHHLLGDTLVNLNSNERTRIRREGDSIIIHIHAVDTLFQMNYDNVVRKYKGYYFLNTRYGKTSWEVKKVQLSKGRLTIGSISTKLDLENLKEITETAQDTVPRTTFTVTKKQFKDFVKSGGFQNSEVFVRQKNP
ncbi:MAG: hypothetical protein ACYC1Q_03970 [Bacteroidia bacterium]